MVGLRKINFKINTDPLKKLFQSERFRRWSIISIACIAIGLVIVQLVFPRDRAPFGAKIADSSIAGWTVGDIEKETINFYDQSTVDIKSGERTMLSLKPTTVGVGIDELAVAKQATSYPIWLRFIPTSLFWAGARIDEYEPMIDRSKLDQFVVENQSDFELAPVNARLEIKDGEPTIIDEINGAKLSADQFKQSIESAQFKLAGQTVLGAEFASTPPSITAEQLEPIRGEAEAIIGRSFILVFETNRQEILSADIASWVGFVQDEAQSAEDVRIELNHEKISQHIGEKFDKLVNIAPGVTEVYLTDGAEQSRNQGKDGRAIDYARLSADIDNWLFGKAQINEMGVVTKIVPARINKHQTFTKSEAGLRAYLNSLADEGDIRVSVAQLGGQGRRAGYRAYDKTVAASTYKVYVVVYALNQIAEGKLSYDDQVNGMTVRQCIDRTIVQSDNACPEAMLDKFGRTNINNFLYERGYSRNTNFNDASSAQTTVADLTKVMTEIERGEIVNGEARDFLLGLMKRQVYRRGVPAGTTAQVADKVGFLWGYLNDAAIVYHSSGTYVISIMTNNLSWAKLAEITRKVEGIIY